MNKWLHKQLLATDIRAPHHFSGVSLHRAQWFKIGGLLGADFLALLTAWIVAHRFNHYYSPPPSQLVWWTWFGLPSIFWCFVAVTLVVFAYGGLYRPQARSQNFIGIVKLISFVFLLTSVVKYFYDPAIDLPRSLFFSAWGSSILLVIAARFGLSLLLSPFYRRHVIPVFIIAPSTRIQQLTLTLEQRSHYQVVGAAL
ncbi:MAG: sugar transferase, partial [Synechocystis sp.]